MKQLINFYESTANCTSGFMELDVLTKRSEKIFFGNIVSQNMLESGLRIDSSWRFSCSGTITGLLLGADIRTTGNLYPEVQIWRSDQNNTLNKIASTAILLAAGDFSPDGVLRYTLPSPLPFQSGDMLGIYQPPSSSSVVRLFYAIDPAASSANTWSSNSNSVTLSSDSVVTGQNVLLQTETSKPLMRSIS